MATFEIYFADLTPEKQLELRAAGLADLNDDIAPLAIFEVEDSVLEEGKQAQL